MKLTKLSISDSVYEDDQIESLTHIDNIKQTVAIEKILRVNDNTIQLKASISNETLTEGYFMNTVGIYANDPDEGEILYAVMIAKVAGWMPPYTGISFSSSIFNITLAVGNTDNVNIEISGNNATVVDIQDLQKQIDELGNVKTELKDIPNSNILINGDFSNPVNQRNLNRYGRLGTGSTLTKPGYTIDRWIKKCEASGVEILDGCIRFSIGNTVMAQDVKFGQPLEFPKSYASKIVTLSTEIKEITGYIELGLFYGYEEYGCLPDMSICSMLIDKAGTYSITAKIPDDFDGDYLTFMYYMRNNTETGQTITSDDYVDIKWAKMEYGEVATPFIPRLRGEEVQLCQRTYENFLHSMLCIIPTETSKIVTPLMGFKVKKRVIPKITSDGFYSYANSASKLDARQDSAVVNTNGITYIQLTEAVGATMCYIKNMEVDAEIY
ncbi:MAG: hypothetical protein HFF36_02975 [Coprobacillus sp.]|nr:hypothetical protein [Coprobacillus sp.]